MKPNPDDDTHEGYCDACGLACYGIKHDDGIGPYEFQGYRGIHHDYVFRSHCCDATILDTNPCCSECGKREVEDYGVCLACLEAFESIEHFAEDRI